MLFFFCHFYDSANSTFLSLLRFSYFITPYDAQASSAVSALIKIYINDISEVLTGLTRLFAEDTSLSFSSLNLFEIEWELNEDLSKLSAWAKRWLMKFNAQKTEIMLISNTYDDHNIELIIDNTILQIVTILALFCRLTTNELIISIQ